MERKFYWQPELSIAIIYWSTTFICLFLGFILALEKSSIHWKSYLAFSLFILLSVLSRQRFIQFSSDSMKISYLLKWKTKIIPYTAIEKISWEKDRLFIYYQGKVFDGYFPPKQKQACYGILKELFAGQEIEM